MAKIRINEVSGIARLLFAISLVTGLAIAQLVHHPAPAVVGALVGLYFLFAIKVVRQWAGPYDMSPDGNPIVGQAPGAPGLYVCCGFEGHGFMMAPVIARHFARMLTGESPHAFFAAWRADRFGSSGPSGGERETMTIG